MVELNNTQLQEVNGGELISIAFAVGVAVGTWLANK